MTCILGVRLTRSLVRPINEIQAVAKRIQEGELNHEITYQSADEIGSLAESMRQLGSTLNTIIGDLQAGVACYSEGDFTATSQSPEVFKNDFELILTMMYELARRLSGTLSQINEAADQVSSGSEQVASGAQALSHGATEPTPAGTRPDFQRRSTPSGISSTVSAKQKWSRQSPLMWMNRRRSPS